MCPKLDGTRYYHFNIKSYFHDEDSEREFGALFDLSVYLKFLVRDEE